MVNFRLAISFSLLAVFAISSGALAQEYSKQEVEAQQAIENGMAVFVKRFVKSVPDQSDETIADCKLVSELVAMSALKQYGKDPAITDLTMLSVGAMQRGWSVLYKNKVESGADMNVGEAVQIFSQQDMGKVLGFVMSKSPVCTQIFEAAQQLGLSSEQGSQ